jgi:hypothetical protein
VITMFFFAMSPKATLPFLFVFFFLGIFLVIRCMLFFSYYNKTFSSLKFILGFVKILHFVWNLDFGFCVGFLRKTRFWLWFWFFKSYLVLVQY